MPLVAPDFISPRLASPVAVFGSGVTGHGAAVLLSKLGARMTLYDREGLEFTDAAAAGHRLVIFSPGFSLHHPWLEKARKAGCICLPELDFAWLFWRGRLVAVTGTNGKTTLTEFLVHALSSVGAPAVAAGNIGVTLAQVAALGDGGTADTTAVCEISSFQAEQLGHLRADALLWTNFAEDHLERHGGMDAYFEAKWQLVGRTPPASVFVGTSVARFAAALGRPLPKAACVETLGQAADPSLDGTVFGFYPQLENFVLAAAWWSSSGRDLKALKAAARTFKLGRHRLTRVATLDGVTYWNDSKATNFHAVEAAVARFDRPVVLIAGGRSKGGDIEGFVRRLAPKVAHAVLIGETGPAMGAACDLFKVPHTHAGGIEEAVRIAAAHAGYEGNVLLSPGFSSFDMFRNYQDRGERFEHVVAEMQTARV